MNPQKRNLPFLLANLLYFTGAQEFSQDTTCANTYDCNDCLSNINCVFVVGTCLDVCTQPDTGATCYSAKTFSVAASGEEICALYNADNDLCTAQTTCGECVATKKADGKSCQWYEAAGACFGGGTGPFGEGALECPMDVTTTEPPVVDTTDAPTVTVTTTVAPTAGSTPETTTTAPTTAAPVATTTSAPTTAPTADDLTDLSNNCQSHTNCVACTTTTEECFWYAETATCSHLTCQNSFCGATQCQATDYLDRELCFAQRDCATCTTTTKSDGSQCQWYDDGATGIQWCQVGGCDGKGICGVETCEAAIIEEETDATITEAPETQIPTNMPMQSPTNDTEIMIPDTEIVPDDDTTMEIPELNITTPTTDDENATDTDDQSGCSQYDGYGSGGCVSCLSTGSCAWAPQSESCLASCDVIADATCFDSTSDQTPEEICDQAHVNEADAGLCGSKNYCFTCTSTHKSDGTMCSWYTNGEDEWCDVGGCNAEGICGDSSEDVCRQPVESGPAPTPDTTPPAAAPESSGMKRNRVVGSLMVLFMTVTMTWV